jgi:hypothetical protein
MGGRFHIPRYGTHRTRPNTFPALRAAFRNHPAKQGPQGEEGDDGPRRAEVPAPETRPDHAQSKHCEKEKGDKKVGVVLGHIETNQGEAIKPQVRKNRAKGIEKNIATQEHQGMDDKRVEPRGQRKRREQKNPGYSCKSRTCEAQEEKIFEGTVSASLLESVLSGLFLCPHPIREINGRTQGADITAKDSSEEKSKADDDQCPRDPRDESSGRGHGS